MKYIPHDYQRKAYNWIMEKPKSALFLDMGMGKTVVTLTAVKDLIDGMDVSKVLVIAPKRVAEDTWSRESRKWDHLQGLRISKILGDAGTRARAVQAEADIYVINRENVVWLIENFPFDFDMVVIDELSSFKSNSAKRFKALRKHIGKADRVVGLTGTPQPNGYMDLWPEIYLLDRGERLERTITGYRNKYFRNVSRSPQFAIWDLVKGADMEITRRLSDICMSMSAEDYLKMPEKVDNFIEVSLSAAEKKKYDDLERKMFLDLGEEEIVAFNAAALSGKLLQLANGFLYTEDHADIRIHDRKLEALDEIIDTNPGEPVLVFYNFKADLKALTAKFPKARVLKGPQDIEDWNAGKIPLLFAHPASMGHGINIQEGGHIIVWYGLNWSLELYQQANARLYRQGQKSKTVVIHHLIADGTIDSDVMKALEKKETSQANLISALKERRKDSGKEEKDRRNKGPDTVPDRAAGE